MYNLICFPHYTCGGLISDIFNNTYSIHNRLTGGLESDYHEIAKLNDSNSVYTEFTQEQFDSIHEIARSNNIPDGVWLGTHCWPGKVNLGMFDKIINITTATTRSKLYRWARSYKLYHSIQTNTHEFSELEKIDKFRECAKNYLISFDPVFHPTVSNIEFSDIVEETQNFVSLLDKFSKHPYKLELDRWKNLNAFLYNKDEIKFEIDRYHEAEYEVKLASSFEYI